MAVQEIVKRVKFTDGNFLKESYIQKSAFGLQKQTINYSQNRRQPLEKTVKNKAIKMATNITTQQIEDINAAWAYSISCVNSSGVNYIE